MAAAGWYPDPYDPTRLRYWDGSEWTEHTHEMVLDPVEPQQPAPMPTETHESARVPPDTAVQRVPTTTEPPTQSPEQRPDTAPPFIPNPNDQQPGSTAAAAGRQGPGDIGQWLGRTFRVGLSKLPACLGLAVLGILPSFFVYLATFIAIGSTGGGGIGSPDTALVLFFAGFLAFVGWMLWMAVVVLAQNHLLHEAHLGRPTSIGASLQAGFAGLGRLIWAYIALLAYAVTLFVILGALLAAAVYFDSPALPALLLLVYFGLIALTVWVQIKTAFIVVAAAVAPDGDRPIPVSVELSNGHFWAVFGRMLLLGLVLALLFIPVAIVMSVIMAVVGFGLSDPGGAASVGSAVALSIVFGLLFPVLAVGYQVISFSGVVRLYIDLGGPSRPAPAREDEPVPSIP